MLPTYVALYDVDDVEGFVAGAIERSGLRASLTESEHEQLMAEGLAILYELAERYQPHRPGYSQPGRFSGYAAQFLPRRLGDAWHQANPEHRRVTDETGKRRWHYAPAPLSLDAAFELTGRDNQPDQLESRIRPYEHWASVPV